MSPPQDNVVGGLRIVKHIADHASLESAEALCLQACRPLTGQLLKPSLPILLSTKAARGRFTSPAPPGGPGPIPQNVSESLHGTHRTLQDNGFIPYPYAPTDMLVDVVDDEHTVYEPNLVE